MITKLTIDQRRNNAITDLEYVKSYLAAVLNPLGAKLTISTLDGVTAVLRDLAEAQSQHQNETYLHTPQNGEVAFEIMRDMREPN